MIWQYSFFLLAGVVLGLFIAIKWLFPDSAEIRVGRLVIKGRNNTVNDMLDITGPEPEKKRPGLLKRIFKRRK